MEREFDIVPWYESAVKSNHNVVWRAGQNIGMLLARSGKPMVSYYWFDLWGQLAANAVQFGSGVAPTAGSFTPFAIPQDNFLPPRRLFYYDRNRWLMQVFPSLNNTDLSFWLRNPINQPRGGTISVIGNPDPNFRYPNGWWFRGFESDVDNVTNAGEFWVPPRTDLEVAVLNHANWTVRPQCLYVINQFPIMAYDPTTETGKRMIMRILTNSIPFTDGSIGGDNEFQISPETFREWFGVYPVQWDGVKATYKDSAGNTIVIGEV